MKNSLHESVLFERLAQEHICELITLESACFSTPWGEEQYKASFAQSSFVAFGLRLQGQETLIAYVALYHILDEMEILNIAVSPLHRRCGYGEFLLRRTLQASAALNCESMFLEVRVGNVAARNLYEKLGFSSVGVRKKYYADTGEDACIYKLALP